MKPTADLVTSTDSSCAEERSDLDALLALPVVPPHSAPPVATLLGRVEDTHHPDLPGRVFVRWTVGRRSVQRAWLAYVANARPRIGDSVLLVRPDNDPQWIVTAVFRSGRVGDKSELVDEAPGGHVSETAESEDDARTLRLEPGQRLRVEAHDGTPLVELGGRDGELTLRIVAEDLAFQSPGRLRLSGQSVQIEAGDAGVDMRSSHDVVVRGRTVRIN